MVLAVGWILAGCSAGSSYNPINWWHRQEGGKIAEQRPPPPGADQPYPNLATVPPKPAPADAAALRRLTDSLVADRTNAQHAAQAAPLADPSSPGASPSLFGVGTAPPPPPANAPTAASGSANPSSAPSAASASLQAVNAPPPTASPPPASLDTTAPLVARPSSTAAASVVPAPSAAPRSTVESAPLQPQAAPGQPQAAQSQPQAAQSQPVVNAPTSIMGDAGTPSSAAQAANTALPALPSGPPGRPGAAGAPPPAPAEGPAPMPKPDAGASATIVFIPHTSNLSAPAGEEVKAFAGKRGNATILVTGFGDSNSSDPDAQSAALNLGLSRAQSIVEALKADGVPGNAIRVSAEASGRGASLHLLQ